MTLCGSQITAAFAKHGLTPRPALETDRPFERELVAQTFVHLPIDLLPEEQAALLVEQQYEMQQNAYLARFPGSARLLVNQSHDQVARVWLNADSDEVRLVDVIVDDNHRNRGIGSSILKAIAQLADELALPTRLSVSMGNPAAQRLYERHGFVVIDADSGIVEMERLA